MGKKSKKYARKALKSFAKSNRIFLAALGGVAAGVTLSGIVGTEKAQQMVRAVENSVASISEKVKSGFANNSKSSDMQPAAAAHHG
jgi:hypothetical protein